MKNSRPPSRSKKLSTTIQIHNNYYSQFNVHNFFVYILSIHNFSIHKSSIKIHPHFICMYIVLSTFYLFYIVHHISLFLNSYSYFYNMKVDIKIKKNKITFGIQTKYIFYLYIDLKLS